MAEKILTQAQLDAVADGFVLNSDTELYEKPLGDGTKFVLNLLSGDNAGLSWISREVIAGSTALDTLLAVYGAEAVAQYANAAFVNAQRNKARNSGLPAEPSADWIAKRAVSQPCIWGTEEALAWRPGQREVTVASLQKKIKELSARRKEVTDPSEKQAITAELQQTLIKYNELVLQSAGE